MPTSVQLIRSAGLAQQVEYAYAATAPAAARLVFGYTDQLVEIEAVAAVVD